AALRVREASRECTAQQKVVAAGDDLAFRTTYDARSPSEARADRDIGVPRNQRRDQRQQRREVGGQVDGHVREDGRGRGGPDGTQRPPAALRRDPYRDDARQLDGELVGQQWSRIGARVVRDRDPERVRKRRNEVRVQPPHAGPEIDLLVVYGDDDVED